MARDPSPPGPPPEGSSARPDPPPYTRYRAGPRLLGGARRETPISPGSLRGSANQGAGGPGRRSGGRLGTLGRGRARGGGPITPRRASAILAIALAAWLGVSLVLFLVSAQVRQARVPDVAGVLDSGGYPLTSASTILVLGSDLRTKATHEPGATVGGPSRSDVILLVRTGAGRSARLSIPRDTVVNLPGHGIHKINAAFAFGGARLAVQTIKRFLGLPINHVVEVNFDSFPALIDSMGGVDYTGGCVVSRINGGTANGGFTLRLNRGATHIDGKQALALARTRHNDCNHSESDLTRARRQQKLFQSMKQRLVSLGGFVRLPFISWNAPDAIRSDMGGPTLLGLFGGLAVGGTPATQVMRPAGLVTLPDGEVGLHISASERHRDVAHFLGG